MHEGKSFEDYFEVIICKSYKKALSRCVEEGTFIVSLEGEELYSKEKNKWNHPHLLINDIQNILFKLRRCCYI